MVTLLLSVWVPHFSRKCICHIDYRLHERVHWSMPLNLGDIVDIKIIPQHILLWIWLIIYLTENSSVLLDCRARLVAWSFSRSVKQYKYTLFTFPLSMSQAAIRHWRRSSRLMSSFISLHLLSVLMLGQRDEVQSAMGKVGAQ